MLQDSYIEFAKKALTIPGFKLGSKEDVPYDITDLANAYVEADKAGDKTKQEQYISALMIRYWYLISTLYEKSKTLKIDVEDIVDWIYDSFMKAFKYCSWLDKNKKVSKDPKGAEKCFNQCITSTRQWWFKHYNQDKRKINQELYSLDAPVYSDEDTFLMEIDTQESYDNFNDYEYNDIILKLVNTGNVLDAFIVDGILNQDTLGSNNNFSKSKLIKHIKSLSPEFIDYFINEYKVSRDIVEAEVNKLNSYKDYRIGVEVSKTLNNLKHNKEIVSLCM